MNKWPIHPIIYEINTWVWLYELGTRQHSPTTLASVPKEEWDALADLNVDAIWFMGVWERSPAGIAKSMENLGLLAGFNRALPDFVAADNVGSPYCVRRYVVDERLGGVEGLAVARQELAQRGMRLILDFVPNHVAPDNPWVSEHPDYFIQGSAEEAKRNQASYTTIAGKVFACGRDPYFPAWPDVLQLNAFNTGLRSAVIETVSSIADQCDGIRCDMAMLVMNNIFQRTWGERAGPQPAGEYWPEVIEAVHASHPGFLFLAEAYWDLEWALQQQGFDYCYDKKLHDRLVYGPAENIRLHLCADLAYQERLVRFIENHDEARAAEAFSREKEKAAAVTVTTLPGAVLLHEGQLEGRKVRLPVFLSRRPDEQPDIVLQAFYFNLLQIIAKQELRKGKWHLCQWEGWPDNPSYLNLVAWYWQNSDRRHLVIVNISAHWSQGRIFFPWSEIDTPTWRLKDLFSGKLYERDSRELRESGLYVELAPWEFHFFEAV